MAKFIPGETPLVFPSGTEVAYNCATWAMYFNRGLNTTWIGYAVPGGTQITQLPGIRTKFSADFQAINKFVQQRQATACGQCGG